MQFNTDSYYILIVIQTLVDSGDNMDYYGNLLSNHSVVCPHTKALFSSKKISDLGNVAFYFYLINII